MYLEEPHINNPRGHEWVLGKDGEPLVYEAPDDYEDENSINITGCCMLIKCSKCGYEYCINCYQDGPPYGCKEA